MERAAVRPGVLPHIHLPRTAVAARDVIGVGVVVAVVLVAATSLRVYAQGPDWGLQLGLAPDGGVIAAAVRGHGVAWEQHIRRGDRVQSVEAIDAHAFVGQPIGPASEITFADSHGVVRTVSPPQLSTASQLWLPGVAVLFALLGAAVYRWTVDPALARIFLVFSGSTALALASMSGALHGYAPWNFLAASSATVASAAFTMVFLWFPRPVRGAPRLITALCAISAALVIPLIFVYGSGQGTPPPLDMGLNAWMGANLLMGALLLTWRAVRPTDRHVLAPLAVGIGVGILPLAVLNALPQVLGRPPIMWGDSAALTVAAIPLAFAYTILRHRLFALDAHLRRFTFRAVGAVALLAMFVPVWLILRGIGVDEQLQTLIGVLIVALAAPTVFNRTERVLESWFYPPLGLARAGLLTDGVASSSSIAHALVVRAREFVPLRWVAFMVRDSARAREGPGWAVLASDGEVPIAWPARDQLVSMVTLSRDVPGMTVLEVDGSPSLAAAVCVGPRLDNTHPGGVDAETIRLLALRALPLIQAAIFRERSVAQARFSEGLWELARELAGVGPEPDVLRVTAQYAAHLLCAQRATVLWRQAADGTAYAPVTGMPELRSPEELETVVRLDLAGRDRAGYVSYLSVPSRDSMLVCGLGASGPAEALMVLFRTSPFTDEDARRAVEIAEHAAGALRRSQAVAEAADAQALREVDRLRNELMGTVAHEIGNPLTTVMGYAQILRQKADTMTGDDVARVATQIEYAAAGIRNIARDLSIATLRRSGRLELRSRPVDLSRVIPTIAQNFHVLPGGERIVVDVATGVSVCADPSRLDQMIGNLLLNALRYARSGPIVVHAGAAGPGEASIEVRDQGPGIPYELQSRIWERFYRAPERAGEGNGSGLGLAVVRSLAELHGGRVELESNPGSGSTFRIVLPRAEVSL